MAITKATLLLFLVDYVWYDDVSPPFGNSGFEHAGNVSDYVQNGCYGCGRFQPPDCEQSSAWKREPTLALQQAAQDVRQRRQLEQSARRLWRIERARGSSLRLGLPRKGKPALENRAKVR